MLKPEVTQQLEARLARIEGQVRGLRKMIAEPRLCVDILTQVAAVQAALKKVGDSVLMSHLNGCIPDSLAQRNREEQRKRLDELMVIFSQYLKR